MLVIDNTDPTIPVLRPQTNVANGMLKLNGAGKVDPLQMALSDINYIGPWNASGGQTPSQAHPTTTFISGSMFQIDVAGTMTVINSTGIPSAILCSVGAQIIFQNDSSPTFPTVGWYLQPAPTITGAAAAQITLTPTGDVSATNVQDGIAELASEKATVTALTSHTGNTGNPHAVTAAQVGAATTAALSSHTGNTSNPHSTTAAQVGAVALTGAESIDGAKTFNVIPTTAAAQGAGANELTRKDYVDVHGLGYGQTWQSFTGTGTRLLRTNYTNSSGKPISVSVTVSSASTGQVTLEIIVGGVSIQNPNNQVSTAGFRVSVSAIVPNGAVYQVTDVNSSSTPTISSWAELR